MSSVNKAIILGNLGKDPETRYTQNGDAVTNIVVATSEKWKDKSGEKQERTEWHRVTLFGRLAEVAGEYLKKGHIVYLEGKIQTRKYTDKEGIDRYATEVVADRMQLLPQRDSAGSAGRDDTNESRPAKVADDAKNTKRKPAADFDDDIPF